MAGTSTVIATLLTALFVSASAAHAEVLETLEGDARVLASPSSLDHPGASAAHFLWMSAGPRRDVRDAPGALLLFTDGGVLIAMADDDARRFAPWRRDPESGRPLHPDAPDGARCATGVETSCWRPGDRVPYSNEVAVALGGPLLHVGNPTAATVATNFLTGTPLPLVPLNQDPCDAFSSNNQGGCTTVRARTSSIFFNAGGTPTLTDAEKALLGCGPYWGTDCATDGIDLRNAEPSVLMRSMFGVEVTYAPSYYPPQFNGWSYGNGSTQPGSVMLVGVRVPCRLATPLSIPCTDLSGVPLPSGGYGDNAGQVFQSEMAALSFNMQSLLVALSTPPPTTPTGSIDLTVLHAADPFSRAPGQCSFAQPQFCSSVTAFRSYVTPPVSAGVDGGAQHWLWESGAEYRIVDAYGDVGAYLGGRVHVLGMEKSRARDASVGVLIALFPAAGATLAPDTRFAMPNSGEPGNPSFGFAYLSAPEPSGAVLAIAALGALAAISRRRRAKIIG